MDDNILLRRFASTRDEHAFDELVRRYYPLVRRVAFAKTGDSQSADDVAQAVFMLLADRAGSLAPNVVLVGWLFKAATLTASNAVRTDVRRRKWEAEAAKMASDAAQYGDNRFDVGILSLIDEGLLKLAEVERNAVLLHFAQGYSVNETAEALQITPGAAKMRASRGLERLRRHCVQKGAALSLLAIIGLLGIRAAEAAPASLTFAAIDKALQMHSGSQVNHLYEGAIKQMMNLKPEPTSGRFIERVLSWKACTNEHSQIYTAISVFLAVAGLIVAGYGVVNALGQYRNRLVKASPTDMANLGIKHSVLTFTYTREFTPDPIKLAAELARCELRRATIVREHPDQAKSDEVGRLDSESELLHSIVTRDFQLNIGGIHTLNYGFDNNSFRFQNIDPNWQDTDITYDDSNHRVISRWNEGAYRVKGRHIAPSTAVLPGLRSPSSVRRNFLILPQYPACFKEYGAKPNTVPTLQIWDDSFVNAPVEIHLNANKIDRIAWRQGGCTWTFSAKTKHVENADVPIDITYTSLGPFSLGREIYRYHLANVTDNGPAFVNKNTTSKGENVMVRISYGHGINFKFDPKAGTLDQQVATHIGQDKS